VRGRLGGVEDSVDSRGHLLRVFEIAGLQARLIALDGEGTIWRIEVGENEDGARECHGTLEEATWLAVQVARELTENGESDRSLHEPPARQKGESA
jgi:hypothetical protein